MDNHMTIIKGVCVGIGAFISAYFGILLYVIMVLCFAMLLDWITGLAASKKEGTISSKKGSDGILKKFGFMGVIAVAVMIDWLIYEVGAQFGLMIPALTGESTFFSLLATLWILINELISILENIVRISGEENVPAFLMPILKGFKTKVEKTGGDKAEELKNESEEK